MSSSAKLSENEHDHEINEDLNTHDESMVDSRERQRVPEGGEEVHEPQYIVENERENQESGSDVDSIDQLCGERKELALNYPKRKYVTEEHLPNYMRSTNSSNRREQLRIEDDRRRSMAVIPQEYPTTRATRKSSISGSLNFMKETKSSRQYSLCAVPPPHIHPSQIKEVDPNNRPRYMKETESYLKQVEKIEGKKKVLPQQIPEVDVKNKPRYMLETEAYKKKVEKVEGKKKVLPQQIPEVDVKNKPRYMLETEAYKKKVEKEVSISSPKRKMKEVDVKNKPRYMQETKAWEEHVKEDASVRSVNSTSIRNVDTANLPRYMQLTKACRQHLTKEETPQRPTPTKTVKSLKGNPHFSSPTNTFNSMQQFNEREKQARQNRVSEQMKQRASLDVRCTRWEQLRLRTEASMRQRRESRLLATHKEE